MASPDDILHELSWVRGCFPEDALRAALRIGQQIVPRLIGSIESVTRAPLEVPSSYVLHLCALFLLAQMRERRAYAPIVAMCRLADDEIDRLVGVVFTEGLPQILASVAQDDDTLLRELVADEGVCDYARVAALHAMACGAVRAVLGRDRFAAYLEDLLRGNVIARRANLVMDEAACIATDLGLVPCMTEALRAFDDGLIRRGVISRQEILDGLSGGQTAFVPVGPERYGCIDDAVSDLRRWRKMWEEWDELDEAAMQAMEPHRRGVKVGRNDPCPCGSGKKFKKCCGQMGSTATV